MFIKCTNTPGTATIDLTAVSGKLKLVKTDEPMPFSKVVELFLSVCKEKGGRLVFGGSVFSWRVVFHVFDRFCNTGGCTRTRWDGCVNETKSRA